MRNSRAASEKLSENRMAGRNGLYAVVSRFIEAEQERGALRADLPAVHIASTILGPCFFRVLTRLSIGKNTLELTDERFVAAIVDSLWEGLRPNTGDAIKRPLHKASAKRGAKGKP
jgi:hypothetical protein